VHIRGSHGGDLAVGHPYRGEVCAGGLWECAPVDLLLGALVDHSPDSRCSPDRPRDGVENIQVAPPERLTR